MKELVENVEKQIATDKEVISVLPRNGIKAIKTLAQTILEMQEKYEAVNETLVKEIKARYSELTEVEANKEIHQIEAEIMKYDVAVRNTDTRSSFEKMGLDKVTYNINGYYKSNLERLNKELIDCVKHFENVGIKLSADDFNISEYSKEYMEVLLQEAQDGQINSERIKDAFEKEWENRLESTRSEIYEIVKDYLRDYIPDNIDLNYKSFTTID